MAKFTKSIRFGLTPRLLSLIRTAAQKQNVSVSELVRTAVGRYLGDLGQQPSRSGPRNILLNLSRRSEGRLACPCWMCRW